MERKTKKKCVNPEIVARNLGSSSETTLGPGALGPGTLGPGTLSPRTLGPGTLGPHRAP